MLVTSKQQNVNCLKTPDGHEIPSVPDAIFGCIIGRKTIELVYTGGWWNRWSQLVEHENFRLAEKAVGSLFIVTHGKKEDCILVGRRGRI